MSKSIELRQENARILAQVRELQDRADAEKRDLTQEEQASWDKGMADMTANAAAIKRHEFLERTPAPDEERRVFQLQQDRDGDPPKTAEEAQARQKRAYFQAFHQYLQVGALEMEPQNLSILRSRGRTMAEVPDEDKSAIARYFQQHPEYRAQEIGSQTLGGFWVPEEMLAPIEEALLFFGGMREAAQVITTDGGGDLPWPVYDDTANVGRRLAENAAFTETDITVGIRVMKAYVYGSDEVLVSQEFLDDVAVNPEAWLGTALGKRIGRITNTEFTTYAGADGPQGIIRASSLGVTAAATAAITADELQQLKYAVNRSYRNAGAVYMMADATYATVLRLKDGENRYLFMPDPRVGGEPLIHGTRVVVNNDMPALATGNITVEYGDFSHYLIRDVRGFMLQRLNEIRARNRQVVFLAWSRHDGAYINAGQNPIQHLIQA